jgi:hypothetical protein
MSDSEKIGLFVILVGLGLISGKVSAKLARETGLSTLVIALLAGAVGHGLASEF